MMVSFGHVILIPIVVVPGLDPSVTGEPEIFEDQCDLVAVTYEDVLLPITPPACLKILRTWIVVDWCQYDPGTGAGNWEYTQIIKVLNSGRSKHYHGL